MKNYKPCDSEPETAYEDLKSAAMDAGSSRLEWSRHFNDVQDAIGFLFDQCELFNKRITSLYYSIEVRMISIIIED